MVRPKLFQVLPANDYKVHLYYDNGEISDYAIYKENLLNGSTYTYFKNGLMRREAVYNEGMLIDEKLYDYEGKQIDNSYLN